MRKIRPDRLTNLAKVDGQEEIRTITANATHGKFAKKVQAVIVSDIRDNCNYPNDKLPRMTLPINHTSTGMEEPNARFPSGPDNPPQPLDNRPIDTQPNDNTLVKLYTHL